MWRFILVTFAFLGVAFYVASGGSDYAPAPDSLQVVMRDKPLFAPALDPPAPVEIANEEDTLPPVITPKPKPVSKTTRAIAPKPARREANSYGGLSALWEDEASDAEAMLEPSTYELQGGEDMDLHEVDQIGLFDAETLVHDVNAVPMDEAIIATPTFGDIREITANSANMRTGPGTDFETVGQFMRGDSVEVLDQIGTWVELRDLQSGQVGWVAASLVTAGN